MRPAAPDRVVRDVGRRIAELRVAAEQTQEDLAERARVSLKYWQRLEAGRENLTIRSLVRFSNLLGASIIELFVPPRRTRTRVRHRGDRRS